MHFSNNLKILGDIRVPDVKQMLEEKFLRKLIAVLQKNVWA